MSACACFPTCQIWAFQQAEGESNEGDTGEGTSSAFYVFLDGEKYLDSFESNA